jgi:hypothetical protein
LIINFIYWPYLSDRVRRNGSESLAIVESHSFTYAIEVKERNFNRFTLEQQFLT